MYFFSVSTIIDSHCIIHHSFADDLQLLMSAPPDKISKLLHYYYYSVQSCIRDVKALATVNILEVIDNMT